VIDYMIRALDGYYQGYCTHFPPIHDWNLTTITISIHVDDKQLNSINMYVVSDIQLYSMMMKKIYTMNDL